MGTPEDATVLVVDDERDLADLYATFLAEEYEVRSAISGQEALDAMDDDVDVALVDRRLPDVRGEDLISEIRDRGSDIRIVVASAVVPGFDIVDLDADEYLLKPVSREELREAIRNVLVRSSYLRSVREYFALAAARETVLANNDRVELEGTGELDRLESRLDALRREIDSIVARRERDRFRVVYEESPEAP